jgi:hypothetical protein
VASETTTANPELIQTQVASLLVQPLEAASVVLASGVRIFRYRWLPFLSRLSRGAGRPPCSSARERFAPRNGTPAFGIGTPVAVIEAVFGAVVAGLFSADRAGAVAAQHNTTHSLTTSQG